MPIPTSLEIGAAQFADVRTQLDGGFGFFEDGAFLYVLLDMTTHQLDVLLRPAGQSFTGTITRQPADVRVACNGQVFGPFLLNALGRDGPVDPKQVHGEGRLQVAGKTILEDSLEGETRYCFGRNKEADAYRVDFGNPSNQQFEAMGGLGPLIMTNLVTGLPLPVGVGNRYASDSTADHRPITDADWRDCRQRNSRHFETLLEEGDTPYCAVAASHRRKLLLVAVARKQGGNGVDVLRDKLLDAGFECACFTDGAGSTCFAVDGVVLVTPVEFRDNTIEAGFMGVRSTIRRASLKLTLTKVEVNDAGILEGDEGAWTIQASVNGEPVGRLEDRFVTLNESIDLGWSATVGLREGELLQLRIDVENRSSPSSMTDEPPPDVPSMKAAVGFDSDPPWGEGSWSQSNGWYTLHYTIEVAE